MNATLEHPTLPRPSDELPDREPLREALPPPEPAPLPPTGKGVAPTRSSIVPMKHAGKDLRPWRTVRLELSLIVAIGLLVALFRLPLLQDTDTFEYTLAEQEVVEMEEIQQTKQEVAPPPPPRPMTPIAVADDVILDEEPLNLDATLDINEAIEYVPPPPPTPTEEPVVEEEPEIFVVVEDMPQMIGGIQALQSIIEYPEIAVQAGVEGRVIVQFIVDEEGNVVDPVVIRSLGAGLDEEAIRAVSQMRFIPGKQRGKAVRVRFSVPVTFKLKQR